MKEQLAVEVLGLQLALVLRLWVLREPQVLLHLLVLQS